MNQTPKRPEPTASRRLLVAVAAAVVLPAALVAGPLWRWHAAVPRPTFDALAALHAAAPAAPADGGAWPLLRDAWLEAEAAGLPGEIPWEEEGLGWVELAPWKPGSSAGYAGYGGYGGEPEPPVPIDAEAWLAGRAVLVEAGRRSAGFAALGLPARHRARWPAAEAPLLYGAPGPTPAAGTPRTRADGIAERALCQVPLPRYGRLRDTARVLGVDAAVAASAGDAGRWLADLRGLGALARFAGELPLFSAVFAEQSIAWSRDDLVVETLQRHPGLLDEEALLRVSRELERPDLDAPLRLAGEVLVVRDLLQRTHGPGGRMSRTGREVLDRLDGGLRCGNDSERHLRALEEVFPLVGPLRHAGEATAAETLALTEAGYAAFVARSGRPLREAPEPSAAEEALLDTRSDRSRFPLLQAVGLPCNPTLETRERARGARDAARLAVGLARFRLARGGWPDALDDLTPGFLGAVPADRVTGGAPGYAVRGGRPVVWSVGADRDDDGGRPPEEGIGDAVHRFLGDPGAPDGDRVLLGAAPAS